MEAPVARTLTELVPCRFIVPVMRLALVFMVIAVSVRVSVAVFSVDCSEVAISIPSAVKESIEQTELETLMFPIEVIAQVATTGFGVRSAKNNIASVLKI
jgi:hypothetical protein